MFYGEIEGSGFEVIEPEFANCFVGHARVERLWTGGRWSEGLHGLAVADTCCGPIFPTTKSCVMTIQMALSQFLDLLLALPMATPQTDKAV